MLRTNLSILMLALAMVAVANGCSKRKPAATTAEKPAAAAESPSAHAAKPERPVIYDTKADGAKLVADALPKAKADNKRVLLMFGANWCGWCHKLHELMHDDKDIARELLYEYEVVLIDVDYLDKDKTLKHNADLDAKYGNPTKQGLPVLVVLDAEGTQLTTQDTGALEEGDHHNPAKVMEFLKKWQAAQQSADRLVNDALARARNEKKNVFLYFSAPWCTWCHKLGDFLARPEIAREVNSAYVVVKVDIDRMTTAKEIEARYRGTSDEAKGLPFVAIVDPTGHKLADGVGSEGNIGFPTESNEIDHFLNILKDTSKLKPEQLAVIEKGLHEEMIAWICGPRLIHEIDSFCADEYRKGTVRSRFLVILLSISALPVTQAMCVFGALGCACECEQQGECGRDCDCAGDAVASAVVESAMPSRLDFGDAAPLALAADEPDVRIRARAAGSTTPAPRGDFPILPYPVSDVPLLI